MSRTPRSSPARPPSTRCARAPSAPPSAWPRMPAAGWRRAPPPWRGSRRCCPSLPSWSIAGDFLAEAAPAFGYTGGDARSLDRPRGGPGRHPRSRRQLRHATQPPPPRGGLSGVEPILVIYAENRSFDNLYGLFPGANGIANATPAQFTQVDRDGTVLATLPPVWNGKASSPAFPTDLPNRPFRIDAPPINLPLSVPTRDLVHRFYQNVEQINGGRNDRFVAASG